MNFYMFFEYIHTETVVLHILYDYSALGKRIPFSYVKLTHLILCARE